MTSEPAADTPAPAPSESSSARLNIFALPTRTTLLFALIVLVVVLPLCASLGGDSPICSPFILFWMFLLPLRDFLRRPSQLRREHDMTEAGARFPALTTHWDDLATKVARIKPPRLMLMQRKETGPFTFGTFIRRYMALSEGTAENLGQAVVLSEENNNRRLDALLLHELAHFVHRDVWMAFFSNSLLRVTIVFMTLDLIFNSLSPWLYNSLISFFDFSTLLPSELIQVMRTLDPQMAEAMLHPPLIAPEVWGRYEVFVLSAHWPLILGSLILLVFYWRALLRTRELYADARVVQWLGDQKTLWSQLIREQTSRALQALPRIGVREKITAWLSHLREADIPGFSVVRGWLSSHPSLKTRRECLDEPYKIYGSDVAIGVTAGITVVLLNLTLGSLFLSRYIRGPNSGVPFLIGFSIISLSLLPFLCQFPEKHGEYSSKTTRIVLLFTAIKLIPQYIVGFVFAVAIILSPALVDAMAYVLVPGAGPNPPPTGIPLDFVIEVFVIRPALLFTFVMPLVLILFLRLDARIKRRVLRWYSAPLLIRRPVWVLWGITGFLLLCLGLILLPILDAVTISTAHDLLDPFTIAGMFLAVSTLIGATIAFRFWNRRYADRCPRCGARVEQEYRLGNTCSACGELFHPQLCAVRSLSQ